MDTHPLYQLGCDPLRVDQGFIRGHIEMQVPLMDPAESSQVGPKRGAGPLTGIAMRLATAITIIIPRPLMLAVADGRVAGMAPAIALPLIGVQQGAVHRNVLRNQGPAGMRIGAVTDPPALLPRLTGEDTDDGRAIIRIGPVPFPFIGAPPGRIGGVSMGGAFFPQRSGTARRLRRRCPSSQPSGPSR
jgi:hypothetical protein